MIAAALSGAAAPAAGAKVRHHGKVHHHRARRHAAHHRSAPTAGAAGCANANTPATSASTDTMRAAVVCLVNQQRTQRGLPSLSASSQLNSSAQGWTNVMIATGNFTHGPGTAFASRISAAGYNWQQAGENIAAGYMTPSSVVGAWMASPDHCRNILDPHFRNVGTGVSTGAIPPNGNGAWTQDFGLLASQSPLSGNTGPQNGCPY